MIAEVIVTAQPLEKLLVLWKDGLVDAIAAAWSRAWLWQGLLALGTVGNMPLSGPVLRGGHGIGCVPLKGAQI